MLKNLLLRPVFVLALVLALCGLMPPASASTVLAPSAPAKAQTRSLMPIADQLQTLLGAPATPAASAPTATTDTASQPAETEQLPQDTFGTRALNLLLGDLETLREGAKDVAANFTAGPDFANWLAIQSSDQRHLDRWSSIQQDIVLVIGTPFLVALLLELALSPLRRALFRRQPGSTAARLMTLAAVTGIKLVPVIFFITASLTLLDHYENQKLQRLVILSIIYALTLNRLAMAVIRVLLTPKSEALRFIPISNAQARSAYRWIAVFSLIIIYGYFLVDLARVIYLPASVIALISQILGLILVALAIIVIGRRRGAIAAILRGNLSAAQPNLSPWQSLRLWFARRWHVLAIAYLIIGYGVTLTNAQNGVTLMLRGTILTLLILTSLRFLLAALDHRVSGGRDGIPIHRVFFLLVLRIAAWAIALAGAAMSWGISVSAFIATPLGQHILGASLSIGTTIAVVGAIYELLHGACERQLNRRDADGKPVPASARMRTLLPMLRNTALIVFASVIALVTLSEAGINIAPLLAGAGVLGVAIGFGSQTLVKDFLTGLFIVVENTIAIGDVVKIGDHSGVVEAMTLRTLRLRDTDGMMHILPFSEVSQIINMTKDFAYAVIDASVAYDSDLERVMAVLRELGDALQKDPIFGRVIVEPIEIMGIEKMGDSSITLRARLRVRPGKQWDVKRMFLLRMKQRFDKEGIEIPFPTVVNIQKQG